MNLLKWLITPYTQVDEDLITKLKQSKTIESKILLKHINEHETLPGELWTPLHNLVIILLVVCGFTALLPTIIGGLQ